MSRAWTCPQCGAEVVKEVWQHAVCPGCLAKAAVEEPPSDRVKAADEETRSVAVESSETAGQSIGNYRLLRKIGEGGMGEVWEAEQVEPVRRRVALKLIKWGMDTKAVVGRFEAERQALALMNHPTVAKVFDAGATERGRPYFVMELIKGEPITKHCDRQRLTTKERLDLFAHVCEGVQHAHQKGIIHRDIKPSNVLVQVEGKRRTPKIIDFGIAKATETRLTERSVFTDLGQLIGTPEYMSPEQAEMTVEDIDTRTDVYSLGVLLYELLAGALPFDPRELRRAGFDEIRRRIREDEPSKPSTRVNTLGEDATAPASCRRTDPDSLVRQLRGDLDWITLRAMEKDRNRRYGSPSELAEDIQRHLKHEPVLASPPSTSYRLGKFVRRHRVGVAFAISMAVLVIGFSATFVTVTAIQAGRIRKERDRANQEAATATQALEFMQGLFQVSEPSEARGNSITAREILDKGAREIQTTLGDQPEIQARMMANMGKIYRALGLYGEAEPLLEKPLEIRRRILGDDNPDTLFAICGLGWLRYDQGRYDEAETLQLEALKARKRVLGVDDPATLDSLEAMGAVLQAQGRYDEAEEYFREDLEGKRRVLGNDHPDTMVALGNMGAVLDSLEKKDEAEAYYLEALEGKRRVLGNDHPETLGSISNMGVLLWDQGRYDEAEAYFHEALEGRRRVLGNDHPETLTSIGNMGMLLVEQGRSDEAEPFFRESLEGYRRVLGNDHPDTLNQIGNMGYLLYGLGRMDEAESYFREALEGQRRVEGNDHDHTLAAIGNMGSMLLAQGKLDEAEPLYREALDGWRRVAGDDHPRTLDAMNSLGHLYAKLERYDDAEKLLTESVAGARRALPPNHFVTGFSLRRYGVCLAELKRYDEAESSLLEAFEILTASVGEDHAQTLAVIPDLVKLYDAWGRPEKADEWRAKLKDNA